MRPIRFTCCFVALWLACIALPARAAPYTPASDQEVLEVLPARAAEPRMRELQASRAALAREPGNADLAVALVRRYMQEVAAEGDPRYIGYAQAALAPWWREPQPPVSVRVMRAVLLQFSHQFDAALLDLNAAAQQDPQNGEAHAWQAAIHMVQADYAAARRACERLAPQASRLIGAACLAYVDSLTGQAALAARTLQAALQQDPGAPREERLWAWTRLAEIEERRGQYDLAEAAFRSALALNVADGYLLAAYADFLLDRARAAEVLVLLKGKERSDLLLLRLALAAKATGAAQQAAWQQELAARFAAAQLRADTVHQKEESRFALGLAGQAQQALALARQNYAVQREPADARILLEAALAAGQPAAAEPVLKWMQSSGVESAALHKLTAQLKGVK